MSEEQLGSNVTRRDFINAGAACASSLAISETGLANPADATPEKKTAPFTKPYLTPGKDFGDVSRGDPKPYKLIGAAQPEPRPTQKSGRNGIQVRRFKIV